MRRGKRKKNSDTPAGQEPLLSRPMEKKSFPRPVMIALLGAVFVIGLGLLVYPTVSSLWNGYFQTRVIVTYAEKASEMNEALRMEMWNEAVEYNASLAQKESQNWELSAEEQSRYDSLLSVTAEGTMGYVEIPAINVSLPIYHGTGEAVLQEGVGHLEGSSLPVGGKNVHTVLSGHRGLPSSRLFTDLDKIREGDRFYLHVLNETLAYEVDQILTVEPTELEALEIVEGEDYCTLFTCTPYGINTHRLLVRGHRIAMPQTLETEREAKAAEAEETPSQKKPLWMAIGAAVMALLLLLAIFLLIRKKKLKRKKKTHRKKKRRRKKKRQGGPTR